MAKRNDVSEGIPYAWRKKFDSMGIDATWLGAIRGGYGNPLKNLESNVPVSQLVQDAFSSALKARGATLTSSELEVKSQVFSKSSFAINS